MYLCVHDFSVRERAHKFSPFFPLSLLFPLEFDSDKKCPCHFHLWQCKGIEVKPVILWESGYRPAEGIREQADELCIFILHALNFPLLLRKYQTHREKKLLEENDLGSIHPAKQRLKHVHNQEYIYR